MTVGGCSWPFGCYTFPEYRWIIKFMWWLRTSQKDSKFWFVWWRNHSLTIFNNCRKSAADSTFFDLQAHWNRWFQGSISSGQNILKLGKPWKREATLSMSLKWYYIDDIGSFACCGWARTNELGRFSKLWLTSSAGAGHVQVSDIGFAQHQLNIFEPAYLGMICSASCGALSSACATFLPQHSICSKCACKFKYRLLP